MRHRPHQPARRLPRHRRLLIVALVLLALSLVPTISYAKALNRTGAANFTVRTVDWLRDQGLAPVVNAVENWYYSRHAPADIAPGRRVLPTIPTGPLPHRSIAPSLRPATTLPVLLGRRHLFGEACTPAFSGPTRSTAVWWPASPGSGPAQS